MTTELHIMLGIPGSGKSSMAQFMLDCGSVDAIVSSDAIRGEITGDPGDVSKDNKVWSEFYRRVERHLLKGDRVIADATFLSAASRGPIRELAEKYQLEPSVHVMRVDFGVASDRNKNRSRVVPDFVMERMQWNFTNDLGHAARKILHNEGFNVLEYIEEGGDANGNEDS